MNVTTGVDEQLLAGRVKLFQDWITIPIEAYQELLERVEDAADIAWLRKARRKPLQYRSLDEYLAARKTPAARKTQ